MKGNNGFKFFIVILLIGILTYLAAFGAPSLVFPMSAATLPGWELT
jgi:hypothetical protein